MYVQSAMLMWLSLGPALVLFLLALARFARSYCRWERNKRAAEATCRVRVAFLHPECLHGGGGERVLWVAARAIREALPNADIAICAPWPLNVDAERIVSSARDKVKSQFHIDIPSFIPIRVRLAPLTGPDWYPRFTLLLQSLASIALGLEAYLACSADVFVDTANQTFALVPAKFLGAVTVSYVHYPTISTDMLSVVRERRSQFNNDQVIARSPFLSQCKLIYYRFFASLYAFAGRTSDVTMVNSTWTSNHLRAVWGLRNANRAAQTNSPHSTARMHPWSRGLVTVYPPCDTSLFASLALEGKNRRSNLIVSVGQFRPEKNHMLQLSIIQKLRRKYGAEVEHVRLVMIGGARNNADRARVAALRRVRAEMGLDGVVTIRENAPWSELLETLGTAWAGLHTMQDEHFGISVVELQAAGVIAVGHRSGGVAIDIVEDGLTGFLADDVDEYALKLRKAIVELEGTRSLAMRIAARRSAMRFADSAFGEQFVDAVAYATSLIDGKRKVS